MKDNFYKLMLVTHRKDTPVSAYLDFIKVCAAHGTSCVQLREKNMNEDELFEFGVQLKSVLDPLNVPLIINDNVALAMRLDAAGVHLGQTDGDPYAARKIMGPDKIIGVSIEALQELEAANDMPVDYVAASAVFDTPNKTNLKMIWGLEGVRTLAGLSKHPVMGIGGINGTNARQVIQAGAKGVAVIGALHDAPDPASASKALRYMIDQQGALHVR